MHASIYVWQSIRRLIGGATKGLTNEQMLAIPAGFDNNIAWNIGHIITSQQGMVYRLSGLPGYTDKPFARMFKAGTSPADWNEEPDPQALRKVLKEHSALLQTDYEAGQFTQYREYTTEFGVVLHNFEEAVGFNNFHEGLHLGMIQALTNLVDPEI